MEMNEIPEEKFDKVYQELKKEKKKRGRKPKIHIEQEPEPVEQKIQITDEQAFAFADQVIIVINSMLIEKELTPLNPAQSMLIRMGIGGCIKKYGISLDEYPEILLGIGIIWTAYDKYTEYSKRKDTHDNNHSREKGDGKDNTLQKDTSKESQTESDNN